MLDFSWVLVILGHLGLGLGWLEGQVHFHFLLFLLLDRLFLVLELAVHLAHISLIHILGPFLLWSFLEVQLLQLGLELHFLLLALGFWWWNLILLNGILLTLTLPDLILEPKVLVIKWRF